MNFREQRADDLYRFAAEMRAVRLSRIMPLGAWLKDRPWDLVWVRWFLAYALFPFLLLRTIGHLKFENVALAFGVYFAFTWLIVLTLTMRPERLDLGLLCGVAMFTAVVGMLVILPVVANLPGMRFLQSVVDRPGEASNLLLLWFAWIVGVGLLEEGCKLLPVYLFVYRKRRPYRPLTYAYVGVVSGLTFGVVEVIGYSQINALFHVRDALREMLYTGGFDSASKEYLTAQLLRMISLPLIHACWSGIAGFFVGLASIHRPSPRALMGLGLLVVSVLHGTYDMFADRWFGIGLAALTVLIFLSYVRTGDVIAQELAEEGEPTGEVNDVAAVLQAQSHQPADTADAPSEGQARPSSDGCARREGSPTGTAGTARSAGTGAPAAPPPPAPSISLACTACGRRLRVPAALAGRSGRCSGCGAVLQVPNQTAAGKDSRSPAVADNG